jgi:hypothetical protein
MDSNSVNINKFKKFLDEDSVVYKLEISDTSVYLLLCNTNQSSGKEIIKGFLTKIGKQIKFQKLSEEAEEDDSEKKTIYSFKNLIQRFSKDSIIPSAVNQQIIKDISKDQWKDKYLHLVYKDEDFLIKSYEDKDYSISQIILGVFLTEKDKIFSLLDSDDEFILNEFKEEVKGKVSDLFYYDEDEEINQSGDQDQEYYKKVKRNDEGIQNYF